MKRKVFSNGPSLVITLPSSWVTKYGITAGNELDTDVSNDKLVISTNTFEEKKINLNGKNLDRTLLRCLIRGAYRKGYDEIKLFVPDNEIDYSRINKKILTQSVIKQEVSHLIGSEITDQNDKNYIIKKVSSDSKEQFDNLLRRIFICIKNYYNELLKIVTNKNSSQDEFENEYENIKRTISYTLRLINKVGTDNPSNDPILYHIVSSLDLVNDLIKYSARDVSARKVSKETAYAIQEIIDAFNLYYELFYSYSNEKILLFSQKRRDIVNRLDSLVDHVPSREILLLNRLGQTIEIINFLTIDTMGMKNV